MPFFHSTRCFVLACWASVAAVPIHAADGEVTAATLGARSAAGLKAQADTRDAVLLLEKGPLLLRLHVMLRGMRLQDARDEYVERTMRSLDTNGDGRVSREESRKSPLFSTARPDSATKFLQTLDGAKDVERREVSQTVERIGGDTIAFRQDSGSLKGDWEVFKLLDSDGSGFLEAAELAAAGPLIAARDTDLDQCISFDEFLPAPQPVAGPGLAVLAEPAREENSGPGMSELLRDSREPLLARRLMKLYDLNRDKKLSAAELDFDLADLRGIDTNGDGLLNEPELGNLGKIAPSLEIVVELSPRNDSETMVQMVGTRGKRMDDQSRRDFCRVAFPQAVLSISCREVDATRMAIESAMNQFNLLDLDNNGYLDETEAKERLRFQRGLFESIDLDGDKKLFGEEMQQYVSVRGEPAATSCRVNLYDTGHGFFQQIDKNADGRISQRELREADRALRRLEREPGKPVSRTDPPRNFHLEFVRGSFRLFGTLANGSQPLPAFQQLSPGGPSWFQRMDRNSDGDLTWDEFLGPRDIFEQLDADSDGLVDAVEAEAAGK